MEFIFNSKIYHIMSKLAECMILSILWFVFSLPVITFGASTSALYYSVVKVVRKDEGSALKDFWHSFKSNFKQSIFVSLLTLAISILIIAIGSAVYAAISTHHNINSSSSSFSNSSNKFSISMTMSVDLHKNWFR